MKPEQQSKREQERAQQLKKLRGRLNPFSDRILLGFFSLLMLAFVVVVVIRIDEVKAGSEPSLGIPAVLTLLTLCMVKWLTGSGWKKRMEQFGVEELASLFEKLRKMIGHMFGLAAVGLACWTGSTLIGMFDFSFQMFTGFCGGTLATGLMYRHYRRTEQQARRLAEQDDA